jgi:hypothetical protein
VWAVQEVGVCVCVENYKNLYSLCGEIEGQDMIVRPGHIYDNN